MTLFLISYWLFKEQLFFLLSCISNSTHAHYVLGQEVILDNRWKQIAFFLFSLLLVGKYLAINPRKRTALLSGLALYLFAAVHHLVFLKFIPPAPKAHGPHQNFWYTHENNNLVFLWWLVVTERRQWKSCIFPWVPEVIYK